MLFSLFNLCDFEFAYAQYGCTIITHLVAKKATTSQGTMDKHLKVNAYLYPVVNLK